MLPCNCRKKEASPLEGKCRANDIVYQCVALATGFPDKVYLGSAQGEFKKQFHNHNSSFKNKSKKISDLKLKYNATHTLKWHILKSVAPYLIITKKCRLCLQQKLEILSYPNPDKLLNKRSELVSKCCHVNKFLLPNYKVND